MSNVDLSAAINDSATLANNGGKEKQKRNREKALPFPALAEGKRMYKTAVQVDPAKESMPPCKMFVDDLNFYETQVNYANALITFATAKVEELAKLTREERVASKKAAINKQRAASALKSKAVRDELTKNPVAIVDILKSIGVKPDQLLAMQEQLAALLAAQTVG